MTVRGAGWAEMILLLFGKEVSVGFGWLFLIWVSMHMRHTPPSPLERGDWKCLFLVGNEWIGCEVSPLDRG